MWLFVLLVSIFGAGSPMVANLNNEQVEYIQYVHAQAIENNIPVEKFLKIINCESGFNKEAFNAELTAKKKGITKYSSCGLLQHNDKRCNDKTSELYDPFYSIDLGIEKYKQEGFYPWKNCMKKVGLINK